MDQYVVDLKIQIMYFDLLQLVELIKESNNDDLLAYVDTFQEYLDNP